MSEIGLHVMKRLPRRLFWIVVVIATLLALEPAMTWRSAFIAEQRLKRAEAIVELSELQGADNRP